MDGPLDYELDNADVLVRMGYYAEASPPTTLATTGLGSCIGLAVYDQVNQVGFLAHDSYYMDGSIEAIIELLSRRQVDTARAKAWLRGGQDVGHVYEGQMFRDLVVSKVIGSGILVANIDICWTDDPDEIVDMMLDTASGKFTTVSNSLSAIQADYLY